MPTYDYVCDACGHELELFQRITESPKKKCPSCSKSKLRRLIGTGGAVLFKGSGFYETDYRSEGYKKAAESDKPSSNADSKKTGSDKAKPAATPDVKTETSPKKTDAKPTSRKKSGS